MNIKAISRNVGYALLVSALFMLLSIIVSAMNGRDSAFAALIISFTITFIVGVFPFIFVRRTSAITLKDGYMIIVLSWLLSFIFGMLPYALWGGPFTIANAWFESVSGFTTTGATILDRVEVLPDSLLFWRASTHFIGGLGVVVFLLLIIPTDSRMRLRLSNMELSSMSRAGYNTRANKSVSMFAIMYIALVIISFVSYLLAGMSPLDAICHAFSVSAAGGFSTRSASIGAFCSRPIEILTMVFMLLSSLHFGLLYMSVATRSLRPLNNPVVKFYFSALAIATVVLAVTLKSTGHGISLWEAAFQTVCVTTTTGFAIVDNAQWPISASAILLVMGVMCACAGSTSGGVKVDRVMVGIKSIRRQVLSILHPSSVNEIRLGRRVLSNEEVSTQVVYMALYALLLMISVVAALMLGVDTHNAFGASITSLSNVGPALGELGTMGSFNSIPDAAKLLYSLDMFLGRIEIYPVLAVLGMVFGGHRGK